MNTFLASTAAPWVIVLGFLAAALAIGLTIGRLRSRWRWAGRGLGVVLGLIAVLLAIGAGVNQVHLSSVLRANPPRGEMVEVDGDKVRVLCEGPRTPTTLLWMAGGYEQALWLDPLHERMKGEIRSCEIDRPGLGYSELGALPITLDRTLQVTHDALAKVGETGPLIIIGHSMGGIFATNYYQAYPNQVKAIIQLDPTPYAWNNIEQPATIGCEPADDHRLLELAAMFGLADVHALNPYYGPIEAPQRSQFDPKTWDLVVTLETQPKPMIAAATFFHTTCEDPFALIHGPGSLGDLPVLKIIQDQPPAEALPPAPRSLSPREHANWLAMRNSWTQEYVGDTTHGTLLRAGAGWGHYFPLTHLDWTLAQIRAFIAKVNGQSSVAQ
jgi:pimeloyl-ACP methyl ester carboxylesterase